MSKLLMREYYQKSIGFGIVPWLACLQAWNIHTGKQAKSVWVDAIKILKLNNNSEQQQQQKKCSFDALTCKARAHFGSRTSWKWFKKERFPWFLKQNFRKISIRTDKWGQNTLSASVQRGSFSDQKSLGTQHMQTSCVFRACLVSLPSEH